MALGGFCFSWSKKVPAVAVHCFRRASLGLTFVICSFIPPHPSSRGLYQDVSVTAVSVCVHVRLFVFSG